MTCTTHLNEATNTINVKVTGYFNFNDRDTFFDLSSTKSKFYDIDLSEALGIDSAALGMLLMLKENSDLAGGEVRLSNPSESVLKVLQMSNFNRIFTVTNN